MIEHDDRTMIEPLNANYREAFDGDWGMGSEGHERNSSHFSWYGVRGCLDLARIGIHLSGSADQGWNLRSKSRMMSESISLILDNAQGNRHFATCQKEWIGCVVERERERKKNPLWNSTMTHRYLVENLLPKLHLPMATLHVTRYHESCYNHLQIRSQTA